MHKVFEIGKNYRNEGIDLTHNPEFTAIEVYEAYADYEDWIAKTEELIYHLVVDVINKDKPADQKEILVFHPQGKPEHVRSFLSFLFFFFFFCFLFFLESFFLCCVFLKLIFFRTAMISHATLLTLRDHGLDTL